MASSYTLGKHFEDFIKMQVATGRYASASEVVREALRLLEDSLQSKTEEKESLRMLFDEGKYTQ